jgi:hypothetical protein
MTKMAGAEHTGLGATGPNIRHGAHNDPHATGQDSAGAAILEGAQRGRVVPVSDRERLEDLSQSLSQSGVCRGNSTVGSNPTLSANRKQLTLNHLPAVSLSTVSGSSTLFLLSHGNGGTWTSAALLANRTSSINHLQITGHLTAGRSHAKTATSSCLHEKRRRGERRARTRRPSLLRTTSPGTPTASGCRECAAALEGGGPVRPWCSRSMHQRESGDGQSMV